MYSVISSQQSLTDLITLNEAKRQCRIMPTNTLDDDDLNHLISACSELAQVYTHRLLTPGIVNMESDEYSPVVQLPWGEATTIQQVLLDDVETEDYTFSTVTQKLKINTNYSNIKVTYDAGYINLPARVKQGILMMISTWYNNREDYVEGMTVQTIPLSCIRALDSVRLYNV